MPNPTYRRMGDHTESLQIDFDPTVISYEQLLRVFWSSHDTTRRTSGQYMKAIWFHDEDQRAAAEASCRDWEANTCKKVQTPILQFTTFTMAEDYHQKFFLRRQKKLMSLIGSFSSQKEFACSTLTTKLNGFVGSSNVADRLERQLPTLQLSPPVATELRRIVRTMDSKYS